MYSDLKLRDHRSDTNGLARRWFLRRNIKNACLSHCSADARRQGVWNKMHYPCRVLRALKKPRARMLMLANDFDWTSSPVLDICDATCLQHRVEIDLTSWGGVGRGTHNKHTRMLPRGRHSFHWAWHMASYFQTFEYNTYTHKVNRHSWSLLNKQTRKLGFS